MNEAPMKDARVRSVRYTARVIGLDQELVLHIRIAIPLLGGTQCLALSPEHHAL